jgi:hypothetical protein
MFSERALEKFKEILKCRLFPIIKLRIMNMIKKRENKE